MLQSLPIAHAHRHCGSTHHAAVLPTMLPMDVVSLQL